MEIHPSPGARMLCFEPQLSVGSGGGSLPLAIALAGSPLTAAVNPVAMQHTTRNFGDHTDTSAAGGRHGQTGAKGEPQPFEARVAMP